MRRRDFIKVIAGSATGWPLAARAQQSGLPIIGMLEAVPTLKRYGVSFRQGLADAGFAEGRNVTIEERIADGQYDRLPEFAVDLVRRRVAVIAAITPVAALAAKAATSTIPIVFELGSDPVKDGLVTNLARPGGNITGVTFFANLLTAKRLELLHDVVPNAGVVGLLLNPANANAELELSDARDAAQALGLQLIVETASTAQAIDLAFADVVQKRATALLVAGDAFLEVDRAQQIVELAIRHGFATCFSTSGAIESGGLVSYSAKRDESIRQFGAYVGRVLKGERPADIPVIQSSKFELVINLTTAKALGLTLNRELLLRADKVIE
jgi:putative ABC transport system substrate-binding protein